MDIKTIITRFAEVEKQEELFENLGTVMKKIEAECEEMAAERAKFAKEQGKLLDEISRLDTFGVKAFEDYKQHVLNQIQHGGTLRQLPMAPLEKAIEAQTVEVDEEFQDWLKKKSGPLPAKLKPGMIIADSQGRVETVRLILDDPQEDRSGDPDKAKLPVECLNVRTGQVWKDFTLMKRITPQQYRLIKD
jgi:hypothetical protein